MRELSQFSEPELRKELSRRRKLRKEVKRKAHGEPKRRTGSYFRGNHEYLEGVQAHFWRRLEIYRAAGGDITLIDGTFEHVEDLRVGMCQGCAETHEVGWYEGEWHHNVKTLGGKRCDCVACGLWVCPAWHKRYHNRVIAVRSGKDGA
jgi:hypothetical protein